MFKNQTIQLFSSKNAIFSYHLLKVPLKRFSDVPNSENEQIPNRQVSDYVKKHEHENLKSENKGLEKELTAFKEACSLLMN